MQESLKEAVGNWYKQSPKRAVPLKILWNRFQADTQLKISYEHFREQFNKISRGQSIKTGGYYSLIDDFVSMTVQKAFSNVNATNTICIDEKPFSPKKYKWKSIRVHCDFRGKGTA